MASIEEIQKRIEAKRRAQISAREHASIADWEAYEQACEEHGYDAVKRLLLPRYVEGLPTFLVVCAAPADNLRMFKRSAIRARKDRNGIPELAPIDRAFAELGRACIVYPDKDTVERIKEYFPTVEKDAGSIAKDLSQAEAEAEGNER